MTGWRAHMSRYGLACLYLMSLMFVRRYMLLQTFEDHGSFTAYCVIVVSCGQWYTRLGMWLNEWEDHPTHVEKEHHLIVKLMCFQFCNYFSYFFYIAFWLRDMERLHDALLDWMIVKTVVWQVCMSQDGRWSLQGPIPKTRPHMLCSSQHTCWLCMSEVHVPNDAAGRVSDAHGNVHHQARSPARW